MNVRHETATQTGDRIAGIARSTEAVSIGLLSAIDGTVDAMNGIAQVIAGFSKILEDSREGIEAKEIVTSAYIDPDDVAIGVLLRTLEQLKDLLPVLIKKRASIDCDCRLLEHHCEALHDAYQKTMEEIVDLMDIVQGTRDAIISHDLKAEPRDVEVFSAVDLLIADLRSK